MAPPVSYSAVLKPKPASSQDEAKTGKGEISGGSVSPSLSRVVQFASSMSGGKASEVVNLDGSPHTAEKHQQTHFKKSWNVGDGVHGVHVPGPKDVRSHYLFPRYSPLANALHTRMHVHIFTHTQIQPITGYKTTPIITHFTQMCACTHTCLQFHFRVEIHSMIESSIERVKQRLRAGALVWPMTNQPVRCLNP